jgi:general stress protein 26
MSLKKFAFSVLLGFYRRRKQSSADLGLENCLKAARATIGHTRYCFLISEGVNGWSSARFVEPIPDLSEFAFFIGTNPELRKIKEIETNPKVTLAFGSIAERANLIVYGTATISTEAEMKRRYWKGVWRLFFPRGPNSNDYAVIQVRAEKMELMNFRRNVIGEPFGLRPVVLQRVEQKWAIQA